MKKFLLLAAALLIAELANAQWHEPRHYPADELKGTAEYYSNLYECEAGYFVSWSNENYIKISTARGIFDYDDNSVSVLVGFYVGDTLEEKVTARFYVPDGDADTAYSSSYRNPDLGRKIINHLKTKGKVRFIASRYSGGDFDMTIPMNAKLK